MSPDPGSSQARAAEPAEALFSKVLGFMSIFTMLMTVPQVLTIWVGRQAAGVSVLSWGAYLLSSVLWLFYGLKKNDRNIYLPCIGWIALNGAVLVGAIVHG